MDILTLATCAALFSAVFLAVIGGGHDVRRWVLKQEQVYGHILRSGLLIDVRPRSATYFAVGCVIGLAMLSFLIWQSLLLMLIGGAFGVLIPMAVLRGLRARRMRRLEDQLVDGVQSLASGVRAGLNLVQAIELVARNLPKPISQEFAHMLREYEYGTSVDRVLANAADRIGSSNYRLVFSALRTHRERGGDLGVTLDRISESVREIQRLEKKVETLTAQGRSAARWMGVMPAIFLVILYFIDSEGVTTLFVDEIGKIILALILGMNIVGFLWIRHMVRIDI